jgi:hypothetical protein
MANIALGKNPKTIPAERCPFWDALQSLLDPLPQALNAQFSF